MQDIFRGAQGFSLYVDCVLESSASLGVTGALAAGSIIIGNVQSNAFSFALGSFAVSSQNSSTVLLFDFANTTSLADGTVPDMSGNGNDGIIADSVFHLGSAPPRSSCESPHIRTLCPQHLAPLSPTPSTPAPNIEYPCPQHLVPLPPTPRFLTSSFCPYFTASNLCCLRVIFILFAATRFLAFYPLTKPAGPIGVTQSASASSSSTTSSSSDSLYWVIPVAICIGLVLVAALVALVYLARSPRRVAQPTPYHHVQPISPRSMDEIPGHRPAVSAWGVTTTSEV